MYMQKSRAMSVVLTPTLGIFINKNRIKQEAHATGESLNISWLTTIVIHIGCT